MQKAFSKNLVFLAQIMLLAFIVINVFSFSHLSGMEPKGNGVMSGCIFDGRAEMCKMSIFEHIGNLQNMLTAHPAVERNILMLALFLAFIVIAIAYRWLWPAVTAKFDFLSQKLYILQHPDIPLFNSLQRAFAKGILNPKIYNLAVN